MIILDTNVLSELLKQRPATSVVQWLNAQEPATLFISTITVAEMVFGVSTLPAGKRKTALDNAVGAMLALFERRTLSFDEHAARQYATLAVRARAAGLGFPTPDGYIASIAAARGFIIASRDTAPYAAAGLSVLDPWRIA